MSEFGSISFDLPKNQSNVIKVIGVGGGGSNAINHMFKQGIKGVDFVVCNTDSQALQNSPVPNKIQLGVNLTEGLGAGANPEVGQQSAIESVAEIEKMLDSNTKMVFITAGMGGGTGTGAAPSNCSISQRKRYSYSGYCDYPFSI
jgi:cell division protein FtsZ